MPHSVNVVFVVGFAAAICLAAGYVLQQRVAAHATKSNLLSYRLLWELMHKPVWWAGIAAMVVGQLLGGLALGLGSVALVEPMLASSLLFAFLIAALISHHRVGWFEVGGALMVCAALGVFIAVGNPRTSSSPDLDDRTILFAVAVVGAVVFGLVAAAKRRSLLVESILLSIGAGLLYGLQDAGTRATTTIAEHQGLMAMLYRPWAWVVLGAGVVGLLLSQSAFRAARLDYSLPPIAVAEPVAGILLGVSLLGDSVSVTIPGLTVEAVCLLAMIIGVVLIGRSPIMADCGQDAPAKEERRIVTAAG